MAGKENRMKYHIAIIGCGQLGSRHVQAMALSDQPYIIHAVDPSKSSLETARQRFLQAGGLFPIENIFFHANIDELPEVVDCAIIATAADIRKSVLDQLLGSKTVRYLILEKFLFQSLPDYDAVASELGRKKIPAWVNCPQRLYPVYERLKASINPSEKLFFSAIGSNWGLACNGIHYIDLFSFLSGQNNLSVDGSLLDAQIIQSKRKGFSEVTGMIQGNAGKSAFSLVSFYGLASSVTVSIAAQSMHMIVREGDSKYWHAASADNWIWKEDDFGILFQSKLTHCIVKDIINTGSCKLPEFSESAGLHRTYLAILLAHFGKIQKREIKVCPIT
jgi:predicted dehydrogenase